MRTSDFMQKIIIISLLALIAAGKSYPQNGRLDETFGNKGIVTTAAGEFRSNSEALSVKIQNDGKTAAGGFYYNGNDYDFAVARYNPDGSLDNSFGTNGIAITPISSGDDEINSIIIQTDPANGNIEKIIAAGFTQNINDTGFVLVRYNPNGSLDSTFGGDRNGIVISGNDYPDYATSVVLQKDGKIVLAGYKYNGHDYDFMIARFSADGIPDNSFGQFNGLVTTEISGKGTNDRAYAAAIQEDGDILAAGSSDEENSFALVRYKPNGSLDTSFANRGIALTIVGDAGEDKSDVAFSISIQEDEKIIIGGRSYDDNLNNITLLRYKSDGRLDSTFNNNGIVITNLQNNSILGTILLDKQDGGNEKIIAAGSSFNGLDLDITLVRYKEDGKPDDSFGSGGIVIIPRAKSDQTAFAADYQTDPLTGKIKKIITAGYYYDGSNIDFALASFTEDGVIDKKFGTNGIVNTSIGNTHSALNAISVQRGENGEEKIIAGGYSGTVGNYEMTLVRYNSNGELDSTFGLNGDGIVKTSTPPNEWIRGLIIKNDGKIIAVSHTTLIQYSRDGIIDTLFGLKGIVNLPITATDETNHSAAIQNDGKIIIAGGFYNGSDFDYAVVRYDSSGNLDTDFGGRGDGIAVTPIGTSTDFANSMALQNDGKIVVAGDYRYSSQKIDIALIRYNSNGILDNSFGTNGIVLTKIGSANDFAYSTAIQGDGKIIAAGASVSTVDYDFALVRYNPNGSIDSTFGTNGIVMTQIGGADDIAASVTLQTSGGADRQIIAAGKSFEGNYVKFTVVRYNLDGSPDNSFGTNGIATIQIGVSSSSASSVLVQRDGKIVAGGTSSNLNADYSVFTLLRFNEDTEVGIDENNSGKGLSSFKLEQNYPNPFNPTTKIKYTVGDAKFASQTNIQLKVYDVLGKEIAVLVNKEQKPGNYEISFNAASLSSGVYFYQLIAGGFHIVKKMIVIR